MFFAATKTVSHAVGKSGGKENPFWLKLGSGMLTLPVIPRLICAAFFEENPNNCLRGTM